jgi:hypothetical protein
MKDMCDIHFILGLNRYVLIYHILLLPTNVSVYHTTRDLSCYLALLFHNYEKQKKLWYTFCIQQHSEVQRPFIKLPIAQGLKIDVQLSQIHFQTILVFVT